MTTDPSARVRSNSGSILDLEPVRVEIAAPKRLREVAVEQIDERPHAECRRDGADAECRTEDEADENADEIRADAAEPKWYAGPIGQNERDRAIGRDALWRGIVQREARLSRTRLVAHHCHIVETGNESFRFQHSTATAKSKIKAREQNKQRNPTEEDVF